MTWTVCAEGGQYPPDLAEAWRALALLADPSEGLELRGLPSGRSFVRAGDAVDSLCRAARVLAGRDQVYYCCNPVPADHGDRAAHDDDVLRRRWLPVDVDRVKTPADRHESATDDEKGAAREVAGSAAGYLSGRGWPAPVLVDSGNGWHLLYRVDLPNDAESRDLVQAFLRGLASRLDTDRAEIDTKCYNASRVMKLPGTWARKGTPTALRPHRMARLAGVPDPVLTVPVGLIQSTLADLLGTPDTPGWKVQAPAGGQSAYARRALEGECGRMMLARPGGLNEQLFKSAAALGNLVAAGLLTEGEVADSLLAAARSAGADDPRKDADTVRRGLERGRTTPRDGPRAAGKDAGKTSAAGGTPAAPTVYALPDLLGMQLPPPSWAVPGLMSEGLTILAGKPKLGKSWLALNLALTIAAGGRALGDRAVEPGDVLYLSLEDRLRRVQDRARKVLAGLALPAPPRLHVAVAWPNQEHGGLDALAAWCERQDRPALVVIDVWAKFRTVSRLGRSAYDQDYQAFGELKALIDHYKLSCLPVLHCKKGRAEDILDEVSGTLGQAGATDGVLVLTRARNENEAELFVTGRDVEEVALALEFDPKGFTWVCHGKASERAEGKYRTDLIGAFKANPGVNFSPKELCDRLHVPDHLQGALRKVLYRMEQDGEIIRAGYGKYRWPVRDPDEQPWTG